MDAARARDGGDGVASLDFLDALFFCLFLCRFAIGYCLLTPLCISWAPVFPPLPRPLRKPTLKFRSLSCGKPIPLADYISPMRIGCCIEVMEQGEHFRGVAP